MTIPIVVRQALQVLERHVVQAKSVWMPNVFKTVVMPVKPFVQRVQEMLVSTSKEMMLPTAVHVGILVKAVNRSTRR